MRVLVLGGSGFVGRVVVKRLLSEGGYQPVVASRRPATSNMVASLSLDAQDQQALTRALVGVDAVINCVAGDANAIAGGAKVLVNAALASSRPTLVHMSTMSVYGGAQGLVDEAQALTDDLGWYGHAKIQAEQAIGAYRQAGGAAVILRPGCVVGVGSDAWVGRIAHWLKVGCLGDLGVAGDGPANLVDVDDVAQAAVRALQARMPENSDKAVAFNLAAPDSPRWNVYFLALAQAIQATPVKRLSARDLKREVYLKGVVLKILERLSAKVKLDLFKIPPSIPPSLMRLWAQQIQLDSSAAGRELGMVWTPYAQTLEKSVAWWMASSRP